MRRMSCLISLIVLCTLFIVQVFALETHSFASNSISLISSRLNEEPIQPILETQIPRYSEKIELGNQLFHETKLSRNNNISCATCHNLQLGGSDQLAYSVNGSGKPTSVNTPTVFNVTLNTQYYWSGEIHSLYKQLDDALAEIGSDWEYIIKTLKSSSNYSQLFYNIYPDGVTQENIKDSLLEFQASLLTPDSPFDRYLLGDLSAISEKEQRGYQLFKTYGCAACHQGKNIGGNMVIINDNSEKTSHFEKQHRQLRVPSLRNVEITPPYFHDGSVISLDQAVEQMGKQQLGIALPSHDIDYIVSFLKSLTGKYNGKQL